MSDPRTQPVPPPSTDSAAPPWYAGGLRFSCTQCGNCCSGPPGFVWFDEAEGRAMAGARGEDEAAFYRKYARRIGGRWSLNERQTESGRDCIFLDRASMPGKALCSVYDARPMQCRTWPFWPDNLESPETWGGVKARTPCPGMGQGTLYPVERIRIIRDKAAGAG